MRSAPAFGARGERRCLAGLAVLLGTALLLSAPLAAKPARVVSLNLCTDQLLMLLSEPSRIASVTFLSANPLHSPMVEETRGLRRNHGRVEEVLPLAPDLVLARALTARQSVQLLKRLGYRVTVVPTATTLEEIRRNIRLTAAALEEAAKGEAMIAAFDARLAASRPFGPERPSAVLYWPNGYTSGKGTLGDSLLAAAGLSNLAGELGLSGYVKLPLERLLLSRAEVLVLGAAAPGAPALAEEILRHPALKQRFAGLPRVVIPEALRSCGTPVVLEAIEMLAAARASLLAGRRSGDGGTAE